jgi:predicted RNA-binding Zn-ribbon protein involved in translation (DUF1610 family)
MELTYACPECGEVNRASPAEETSVLTCNRCDYVGLLPAGWALEGRVTCCPMCGGEEIFRQREVRQRLTLLILLLGAVFSILTRFISLVIALLVAAMHCLRAPERLVCYRCGSRITGHSPRGQFAPFDPARAARTTPNRGRGRSRRKLN